MNHTSSSTGRCGTAYLGKDILGSVRSVTNGSGQLEDRYEYDAFGKPYQGDLDNGMNLGYMGKPYDSNTGLYNYGYRDYKPEAARFTTVDPIRDGSNWFVYVNSDPVNYMDLWGLSGCSDQTNSSNQTNSTVYIPPTMDESTLPRLIEIAGKINKTGYAMLPEETWSQGTPLYTSKPNDGCFARASVIADLLRDEGYTVHYAYAEAPLMFGEKAPDGKRFNYHIAPAVPVENEWHVVDPYHYGITNGQNSPGLVTYSEWVDEQQPKSHGLIEGYNRDGSVAENPFIQSAYLNNQNPNLSIPEYAAGLLKYYNDTGSLDYKGCGD